MKILLKIAYDGTCFAGWQFQPGKVTVQKELNDACSRLFGFECDVTGCSRTDAGVHAFGFCATVAARGKSSIETSVPPRQAARALNRFLPPEISVISSEAVSDLFHPRYSAVAKTYMYLISASSVKNPFFANRVFVPKTPLFESAPALMNEAAALLCGRHDFSSYMSSGSSVHDTVREIFSCSVISENGILAVKIRGNGFLYNMVRIISGTLLEVGFGRIPPGDIAKITAAADRSAAGPTLPPYGLYLCSVDYPQESFRDPGILG